MRNKGLLIVLLAMSTSVYGDAYSSLLKRYEAQIREQERQLTSLRKNLIAKEQEAKRWELKAESAKVRWAVAGDAVDQARKMVRMQQERRTRSQVLAEKAEWTVLEHTTTRNAANAELAFWTTEMYKRDRMKNFLSDVEPLAGGSYPMLDGLSALSLGTSVLAERAQQQEATLRMEELHWRTEEQKQTLALDKYRQEQKQIWLRWQEALARRQTLEEERSQMEQSAQALRVMLSELRENRNHTLASRADTPRTSAALKHLKGSLPWPAAGTVTQNFGKQYSDKLQHLIVSNGIRVESEPGKPVRTIQAGKVLFARPFQQYGQLVIIQHQHGLTSVYGELGQTHVKEGDLLGTLDPVGTVSGNRSFYFELRHDEAPINPLVWLEPRRSSELSSRRKFQ